MNIVKILRLQVDTLDTVIEFEVYLMPALNVSTAALNSLVVSRCKQLLQPAQNFVI